MVTRQRGIWIQAVVFGLFVMLAMNVRAQYTVSGTVSGQGLLPVSGVELFLYDDQGNPIGIPQTLTDGSGFYSITGLPPATYDLEFVPTTGTLVPHYEAGVVISGNLTLNIVLEAGFSISGFVTDTTGSPLLDIDINVYDQFTREKLNTPGDNSDATGFYDVLVPAGTYRVRWKSATGDPWVPAEVEYVIVTADTSISVTGYR